jgi:hypothetical protein
MNLPTLYLSVLDGALEHARRDGEWVVVVVASAEGARTATNVLSTLGGDGDHLCGRTLVLEEGGRVTVVPASSHVHGDEYLVLLVGFEGNLLPSEEIALHAWKSSAKAVLTLDLGLGEMQVVR